MRQRIPALDGVRGIAILLVLVDHASNALSRPIAVGQDGVTLFFVLSGFLITRRLEENTSLRKFYIRRAFRILPCAWAFLLSITLLNAISGKVAPTDLFASLCFVRNFVHGENNVIWSGHFWSLSIEEQFYVFWPFVMLRSGSRARWIAVSGCVISGVWTGLHWSLGPGDMEYFQTQYHAYALLAGCSLALWLPNAADCLRFLPILRWKPLCRMGVLSYSIYIWQQPILPVLRGLSGLAIGIPMVALVSYLSFELIEKPLIELGRRYENAATPALPQTIAVTQDRLPRCS